MGMFASPELQRNPYPMYEMMRQSQPVLYVEPHNIWLVFRYDDVKAVLSDHAAFSSEFHRMGEGAGMGAGGGLGASLIGSDPPPHTQMRNLVGRAFTPRQVAALEPRIAAITAGLLDAMAGQDQVDLVEAFAQPLPIIVIAELLGIPAADRARFKVWSTLMVAQSDAALTGQTPPGTAEATREMFAYFREIIAQRRDAPRDDLISALLQAEIDGERLTERDLLAFCWLLLVAGNETTTNLLSNAVITLLEHPEALARLRTEPALLPGAIEEVLRYRSPVQAMFRIANADVSLGGQSIKRDQRLLAWIGSANRDEARFPAADRFDITRDPNPHIAFGHGIHFCLGAPLARLEARVALSGFLARIPHFERLDDAPLEPTPGFIVSGVQHLPLRLRPGAAG